MNLKQMREAYAKLMLEAKAIQGAAGADGMTEEQAAQVTAKVDEAKALKAKIDAIENASAAADAIPAPAAQPQRTVGANTAVTSVKARFEDDPKKGFKSHKEFLQAVMAVGSGHRVDADTKAKLDFLATAGSDEQGTHNDTYGGHLVPVGFSPDVLKLDPEPDPMAGRTTMIPMGTPRLEIPARLDKNHSSSVSGGLTVSRKAETVAGSTSRMSFGKVTLNAYSLFGGAYVTEELLTDSPQSFAAIVAAGFADQFTSHMVNERINGTGVGEHKGVLNADCLISITKETGQAAATLVYNNILKMSARCWRYDRAVWIANHNVKPQLGQLVQSVGTGGVPVYMPNAREGYPDMLLGRPIYFTEYAKTLGTVGDIILGNWSEYLEGVYQPLQSAESIHVRFLNNERTFKFWLRNAGAPWWESALTPKNGDTLSPFVVLATRV